MAWSEEPFERVSVDALLGLSATITISVLALSDAWAPVLGAVAAFTGAGAVLRLIDPSPDGRESDQWG